MNFMKKWNSKSGFSSLRVPSLESRHTPRDGW